MKPNKILAFLLVLLLVAFPFNASAVTDNLTIIDNGEQTVEPLYEPVCGTYAYHRMVSKGFGTVFDENEEVYLRLQCAWQCSRCLLVMVTEGDLYYWGMEPIGKYAIVYADFVIADTACIIDEADYYGYTSNNYLPGYKFYLSQ